MSANSVNRSTVRAAVLSNLQSYLTAAGVNTADIGFDMGAFQNRPLVVLVHDQGSDRTNAFVGRVPAHVWFEYAIEVYAALDQPNVNLWTSQAVEDALALVEKYISDFLVDDRRVAGAWDMIERNGKTSQSPAIVQTRRFRKESIPVRARVIGG